MIIDYVGGIMMDNEKNKFDVQKYLKHQLKVKSDDVFEVHETNIV